MTYAELKDRATDQFGHLKARWFFWSVGVGKVMLFGGMIAESQQVLPKSVNVVVTVSGFVLFFGTGFLQLYLIWPRSMRESD